MARTADRKLQRSDRAHFRRADGITIGKGNGSVHGIFERRNFKDSETGNGEAISSWMNDRQRRAVLPTEGPLL